MARTSLLTTIAFLSFYCFIITCLTMPTVNCIDTLASIDYDTGTAIDAAYIHRTHPRAGSYFVYYGALHNHSAVNGGTGTQEEAYRYARHAAKLDFFGLTDHDAGLAPAIWDNVQAVANAANDDGVYVTFWGFEWTSGTFGHVTVVGSDDYCVTSDPATATFLQLCAWLNARNCVAFFNHPTAVNSAGTEFGHFNDPVCDKIVGFELWNKDVPFSAYYYNEGYDSNDNHKGAFDEALTRGWKVGAAGGSDNHEGTWGTANDFRLAILADSLTRADLYAALKARRFFSTLDKNIALSFAIGGREMGSTVAAGSDELRIQASDGDNEVFSQVVLFDKSHTIRRTWNPQSRNVDISDSLEISDGDYYYVKITQEDGNEAISSPIWGASVSTAKP
jgi:hypothetical protein